MPTFEEKLSFFKQQIVERIARAIDSETPVSLYEPIKYTMQGGGKRLRPVLLLLTVEALGGDVQAAMPAAVAVELLHNFTLVHDDIMDNDATRRGRATVHEKWDTSVALLAGDGLVALAYQTLLSTQSPHTLRISRLFTTALIDLCKGQALDREFETRDDVSMDEYLDMISKKTARLLSLCAQMGAILANGTEDQVQALKVYGESLGMAFQIQDDLLDITADPEKLGKDFGSDIRQKKKTFLLVHALRQASPKQKQQLMDYLDREAIDDAEVIRIRDLFEDIGTLSEAKAAVQRYIKIAEDSLTPIEKVHASTDSLKDLLRLVQQRQA
ncbi:MAG: polyprenyl synthetase family protein [candidate division KSB1 bacterium]|nr:polyprenyl synthetase family protein [candidate division KSB1 bacterium]